MDWMIDLRGALFILACQGEFSRKIPILTFLFSPTSIYYAIVSFLCFHLCIIFWPISARTANLRAVIGSGEGQKQRTQSV